MGNYRVDQLYENLSTKYLKENYLKQLMNTKVTNESTGLSPQRAYLSFFPVWYWEKQHKQ